MSTLADVLTILQSKVSRAAKTRCRGCSQPIGEGIDDSRLITRFDLEPLPNLAAEDEAWAAGETTLGLTRDGWLYRRCAKWRSGGHGALIVLEHECEPRS